MSMNFNTEIIQERAIAMIFSAKAPRLNITRPESNQLKSEMSKRRNALLCLIQCENASRWQDRAWQVKRYFQNGLRIIAFFSGANDSLLNEITIEVDRPVHWKVGRTFHYLAPSGAQGVAIFVRSSVQSYLSRALNIHLSGSGHSFWLRQGAQ